MPTSCNQSGYSEESLKQGFEEAALKNAVDLLKRSFLHAQISGEILPVELVAAFKIDLTEVLKKAFPLAIKEFEDGFQ